MGTMAQWRDMRWEVSTRVVTALTSISISKKSQKETNNDRDGGNPTNTKGFEPQTIPVAYTVARAAGEDPRRLYEEWKKRTGKKGRLILGGKPFGPPSLQLDEVGFQASELDDAGRILVGDISLSFVQDGIPKPRPAQASPKQAGSGIAGPSSGVMTANSSESALFVGPTTGEKKAKKG